MRLDFREPQDNSDVFYDIIDDYPLIEASFLQQYGIRLSDENMTWLEFRDLLACLSAETPLGRVVAIRSEEDGDVIAHFNKAQRNIYNEWHHEDQPQGGIRELFALFKE